MKDQNYKDKELGVVDVVVNPRARRFIMRATADGIRVTVPPRSTRQELDDVLHRNHDNLLRLREKHKQQQPNINFDYNIETDLIQLHLIRGSKPGFYLNRRLGSCEIVCPADTDFSTRQQWLSNVVTEQLRLQAKTILPERLKRLAAAHGFQYRRVCIQSSHTRWGSCSAGGSINLSLYLMTLPSRLVDYVLLHELCHTVHHDHSADFWALMDEVTDKKAHALRHELRKYHTGI